MPLNPVASDAHIQGPLNNISVAHMQDASRFVAGRAFPVIPVAKEADKYYVYPRGEFNRNQMKKRADGTESAGAGYKYSNDSYFADVYAEHVDVSDRRRANSDTPLRPDREATEFLTTQYLISREANWATNFFAASKWATDVTPGTLWSAGSSTPIEDIRTGIKTIEQNTGFTPNKLVLGADTFYVLIDHADIIDRVKYGTQNTNISRATAAELATLFDLDEILVMKGIQNTAEEGATDSHAFIGGKHALLCYAAPSPGLMTPSAGYTFAWNGYLGASDQGSRITKFRMNHLKADRVEIEAAYDQKLVSTDLGYFFESVVS